LLAASHDAGQVRLPRAIGPVEHGCNRGIPIGPHTQFGHDANLVGRVAHAEGRIGHLLSEFVERGGRLSDWFCPIDPEVADEAFNDRLNERFLRAKVVVEGAGVNASFGGNVARPEPFEPLMGDQALGDSHQLLASGTGRRTGPSALES
jgi:hypothetical protein